jgi:GTPase SAR1 family protein
MNESNSVLLKIVLTGDAGVGKTSLIEREVENVFPVANPTIGTNFKAKQYDF